MTHEASIARLEEHKATMDKFIKPTMDMNNSIITLVRAEEMAIAALQEQESNRWIPVTERLPTEDEYLMRDGDNSYYGPITIAYKTDIIEYKIGCYDGYKWMNAYCTSMIKNVVAWKPFEEYRDKQINKNDS